tara:strand:+ start:1684 stop:2067 length:384 start_codon:yes stop_codon:yes gene_type:complete
MSNSKRGTDIELLNSIYNNKVITESGMHGFVSLTDPVSNTGIEEQPEAIVQDEELFDPSKANRDQHQGELAELLREAQGKFQRYHDIITSYIAGEWPTGDEDERELAKAKEAIYALCNTHPEEGDTH